MIADTKKRIAIEAAFVRIVLQVEAELGGQIFLDRSVHCAFWGCRVCWPKWEEGVGGTSVVQRGYTQGLLRLHTIEGARADLKQVRELVTAAIAKLREDVTRESDKTRKSKIAQLKRELKKLEQPAPEATNG